MLFVFRLKVMDEVGQTNLVLRPLVGKTCFHRRFYFDVENFVVRESKKVKHATPIDVS
jgi:hypothetical protein